MDFGDISFDENTIFYYEEIGDVVECKVKELYFDLSRIIKVKDGYDISKAFWKMKLELANGRAFVLTKTSYYDPNPKLCLYATPKGCHMKDKDDMTLCYDREADMFYFPGYKPATIRNLKTDLILQAVSDDPITDMMFWSDCRDSFFGFKFGKPKYKIKSWAPINGEASLTDKLARCSRYNPLTNKIECYKGNMRYYANKQWCIASLDAEHNSYKVVRF